MALLTRSLINLINEIDPDFQAGRSRELSYEFGLGRRFFIRPGTEGPYAPPEDDEPEPEPDPVAPQYAVLNRDGNVVVNRNGEVIICSPEPRTS